MAKNIHKSFEEGNTGEKLVIKLLTEAGYNCKKSDGKISHDLVLEEKWHIEVKYDIMSKKTGNIAIEYRNSKKDAPSGIHATKADIWAHIIVTQDGPEIYVAKTKDLLEWTKNTTPLKLIKSGGDDNADLMIYPITKIVNQDSSPFKPISKIMELINEL